MLSCREYDRINNNKIHNEGKGSYDFYRGVRTIFNRRTVILITSAIATKSFLNYDYNQIINDLQKTYNKMITDCTYQLNSEFYQDRYCGKSV